jgi:antitoxin Phd
MRVWQVQEAKARFSEFLEASLKDGPQMVTRRGVEAAVLLPVDEWRRLQRSACPSLKDLLLADEPRFDDLLPPRDRRQRRAPAAVE